jgi:hypothetical protein
MAHCSSSNALLEDHSKDHGGTVKLNRGPRKCGRDHFTIRMESIKRF